MATALMMLAEKLPAKRAAEIGMIYRAVPPESLEAEAMQVAKQLAAVPTKGLGLTKRALNASLGNTLEAQLVIEEELQGEAGHTADFMEGVAAFNDKRNPVFRGE